jgi:uncharacterized protein YjbJ (UPF0337 family)
MKPSLHRENYFTPAPQVAGTKSLSIMNTTELKGNWEEQKGKLKQKFATLTDNDLLFAEGKKEEMLGKLQIKLGKTKEEIHEIIGGL